MATDFEPLEGGCTCGKVRYRVDRTPIFVHACHCSWCQRQTGAPHVLNAIYEAAAIELTKGEVEKEIISSPSDEGQMIARCPTCKVTMWSHYLINGCGEHLSFLRVGTLDKPGALPPDIHIFTSSKMPWYVVPEGQLCVEEYYDDTEIWPPEAHERFDALKRAIT